MMDRIALANRSARLWDQLSRGLASEACTLYGERWEQDGEDVADHLFDASEYAAFEAGETQTRLWRMALVF